MELIRSDVAGTRPVSQTTALQQVFPAGDLRQDVYARLMTIAVGRPLPAEIVSQTDSGTSMVRVADTVVQMDLPPDAKVGEKVTLTLLAREPRLTFLFERDPAAHSMLSNTGKLIDNILRSVSQDGSTATLAGRTPLLSTAPSAEAASVLTSSNMASALESMLSNMFSTSGLFYESHLAQWVAGTRSQESLMAEPQAKMQNPNQLQTNQPQNQNSQIQNGQILKPSVKADDQMNQLEKLQEKSWVQSLVDKAAARISGTNQAQLEKIDSVIDQNAAQMIRMQLDAMEQRKVIWQGEFWPGQTIEWEVEDDTPRRQKEYGQNTQPGWQSVLRVNLPLLGEVTATMRLVGNAVQVKLGVVDEDSTTALRQFAPELIGALENAGAKLDYFMVNDETN